MGDLNNDEILFTRAQARASGLTDGQIDWRRTSGSLRAERRGVLRWVRDPDQPDQQTENSHDVPLAVKAALLTSPGRGLVISHATAARVLGLPRPLGGWPHPQFTATSGPTRYRSGIQIKVATLTSEDVVEHLGVLMTAPSRTVVDCLRTLPGKDGLTIADAALHRGLVSTESVVERLNVQARWPGVALARQVFALADGRRESPLESWSAWAFAHVGVPAPEWQVEVRNSDGIFIGRADCWWAGVVGEADGRSKYALAAAERGGNAAAVYKVLQSERQREQRMRDSGADVVRWSSTDVLTLPAAQQLAPRITAACTRAAKGAHFTGLIAPTVLPKTTLQSHGTAV